MSVLEVSFVLDKIKANWSAGTYANIPLERVDRTESDHLDGSVRSHTEDLQADNFVGATLSGRAATPIGTEYDHGIETVVPVRIEGLHTTTYGKIDPDASLPPGNANDPVPWEELVYEIRDAILTERKEPATGRSGISYRDLIVQDWTDDSADYGDYYRADFDVVFRGYETLP